MSRSSSNSSTSAVRRSAAVLVAIALSFLGLVMGPQAFAASNPYTIDGNNMGVSLAQPANASIGGTVPVTYAPDLYGNVKELGPINGSATKVGVINTAPLPMLGLTNPNAQVDLRAVWTSNKRDADGHIWQYFAWERDANSGSGFLSFEFMQNPVPSGCDYSATPPAPDPATCNPWSGRQVGDFMIVWDQSGSSTALGIRYYDGTKFGAVQDIPLTEGKAAFGTTTGGIGSYKGEAAIDLTALYFGTTPTCKSIRNIIPNTVTGNSDTADYKDTVFKDFPDISNCGSITVKKTVTNLPTGATPSFDYTTTGSLSPATFSLGNGGEQAYGDLFAGSYSVTESSTMPANYAFTSLVCTGGTTSITGATANITLAAGDNVVCTYTNNHFKNQPTIATTLSATSVTVGDTVHDSSALTGATDTAGGTVTYTVYTDTACSTGATDAGTKTVVNGVVPDSNGIQFNTVGDFYWQAVYSGDDNNEGATSLCTSEHLVVNKAPSSLTTAQTLRPQDSVTVTATAGGTPTGTVTFTLYKGECTAANQAWTSSAVNLDSAGKASTNNTSFSIDSSTAGLYNWLVSYSGDAKHKAITGTCGAENFNTTITNGSAVTSAP